MPRVLTREEFYDLVWSKPMTHLGRDFGVSDVAMHKHCRKHAIPTPPLGYWAKKAHGKAVVQTPLGPDTGPHAGQKIIIYTGASADEGEVSAAARARVAEALAAPAANTLPVADDPILIRTLAKLTTAKPDKAGLVRLKGKGLIRIEVRLECVTRAGALLQELVSDAARAAITLSPADEGAVWQFEGETVSFQLKEVADRIEHVPTEKELRDLAKWEAERAAYLKRTGYERDWGRPYIPKWEERLQGRLVIMLEEVRDRSKHEYWGTAVRGKFADAKNRDVAKAIPKIVETIAVMAAIKRENVVADARRKREYEEAERARHEAERRAALEKDRSEMLETLLTGRAAELRLAEWLEALSQACPDGEMPVRVVRLQRWATARLARMRKRALPARLNRLLAEHELFEDDADL